MKIICDEMQIKLLILLTVALAIGGCSVPPQRTYSGEQLPPEKVSLLVSAMREFYLGGVQAEIIRVDETKIKYGVVEALPGEHTVEIRLNMYILWSTKHGKPQTMNITTEAGHIYRAYGKCNRGDNQIWIEDQKTKEVIAGNKPK